MWTGDGDYTTWEGLAQELDEPVVVFGTKKPSTTAPAAPKHVPLPASKKAAAAVKKPAEKSGFQFAGITKKKKAPRGAGLMMKAIQAEIVVEPEEEEEVDAEPSPYIKSTKNAFSALEAMVEDVEEADEQAEAAKKAAAKKAPPKKSVVSIAIEVVEKKGLTPVARRTRRAFTAVSETMQGVVDAVVKSPFVQRSRSALAEQSATASNLLFGTASAAAGAAAVKKAPKAAAPPAPAVDSAPVRRSSRLRPVAA